ncbi:MAG TPA: family 1 encapsulin nanocompartment shell protein, partial [Polyangiales bacterium]|nr:family 1 encapsulin nanocompartment shell protein [Polyangiales bacterium]
MSDDLLKRRHAPITDEAWQQIDDEARRVLQLHLAGRKFVDFDGPHGWEYSALNTGRLEHINDNTFVGTAIREVQPLVELRAPITLPILELDYAARGAKDLDLDAVIATAEHVAHAEDSAIFYGYKPGRITGILEASPHKPVDVTNALDWPRALTAAKETLRQAGVNGPYALVASADAYDEMIETGEDGYPLRKR